MLVIRPLHRILGAQALSSLGTSISTVALAVMVFDISGSVLHMGGVLAASTAPLMVMSFVGGALLDRYEGRRLMVLSDIARALLVLAMPLAATQSVALIYVVAGVIGVFSALFNPSQVRLVGLPRVVTGGEKARKLSDLLRESPRTLVRIWCSVRLRTNLLLAVLPFPFLMMGTPNAYGLALEVFEKGPQGFALMEVLTSGGWIAGGLIAGRMNFRGDRNSYVYWSSIAMAACMVAVGLSGSFWLAVAFLTLGAVANVGLIVG